MNIPKAWKDYLNKPGLQFEITEHYQYNEFHIAGPVESVAQQFRFGLPSNQTFLLEKIEVLGLASDSLDGYVRIENSAIGVIYLHRPLIHYAIRNRRALSPALMFAQGHMCTVEVGIRGPLTTGLDLLGKPRDFRTFRVICSGKKSRPI